MRVVYFALILCLMSAVGLLSGCASDSSLKRITESSSSAIRAAEELGANDIPAAAYYLQLAKEESEATQKLIDRRKRIEAHSMSLRATVDAELAVLLAREEAEKTHAAEAAKEVRQLRKDNQLMDQGSDQ